ncbi:helicase SNF2 [Endozoicomonas montiporae]|uniref:Helicase SNF2 n=2 Tax=Endozoicomonas montiporae TaxID=1027273 RepID=A0A081MZU3_9GAMM|nr:helicase-related protein [Endozoicomonas montiporae]AMO54592.1 superfamily II DNA/RNA helicase [Endozoicomonas montiporae CL-33]KEQ11716.1 helicase SNF2 [Endozoicomonas montiporae]
MSVQVAFQPGSIVAARGREWIVLPESNNQILHLRPMGAAEDDKTVIFLPLEKMPVEQAHFPLPNPKAFGTHAASRLLRDAMMLKLRSGAGPFRSFGNIAVEPRAYQLVPLLMAMKHDTVRLLIADDVGIGKTIEAGLIARELLDRGEIKRLTVLCPPHLCEQWQDELEKRFNIRAAIVRTSSAARLERGLPPGTSIFEAWNFTIVSLDYIKSDKRRDEFYRSCPEAVIVDEAHTCTLRGGMQSKQKRFQLLKGLSEDPDRHMVLLTATPHSGDEEAFYNLLGLLRPEFINLKDGVKDARNPLRQKLAEHFVQRRRPDIEEWQDDSSLFPDRETTEITYTLTGDWGDLFRSVMDYARELVESAGEDDKRQQRINWWAALALLRCVSSSPSAAVSALRTRLVAANSGDQDFNLDQFEEMAQERVFDGTEEALSADDIEPGANTSDSQTLHSLIDQASGLHGAANDPKLKALVKHLKGLVKEGFQPVVFCRYIATAHYLAEELKKTFKKATIEAVTGELTPVEREERVHAMVDGEANGEQRILVATDCLSEGINLQEYFTAVVHYDLSWNPTRHEQREGRVDRFGQSAEVVRATMLYGQDNPVDGAVLKVILRKADAIRKELGVSVPMPDDDNRISQALMESVLLRQGAAAGKDSVQGTAQASLFGDVEEELEAVWNSAYEKAKRNRTIFAQHRLKPEDVLPEWNKTMAVLGGEDDVKRFVTAACHQLNAALEETDKGYKLPTEALPESLQERLAAESVTGTPRIDFHYPPKPGATFIHRTHPLVGILADHMLETALSEGAHEEDAMATFSVARCGSVFTDSVSTKTTLLLLRLRTQLMISRPGSEQILLCEEPMALALEGSSADSVLKGQEARELLNARPVRNMPPPLVERHVSTAIQQVPQLEAQLNELAKDKAEQLLSDHRRVRTAADAKGSYKVQPILPVDVMGVYVLIPAQMPIAQEKSD